MGVAARNYVRNLDDISTFQVPKQGGKGELEGLSSGSEIKLIVKMKKEGGGAGVMNDVKKSKDSYGDGICCNYGQGGYTVKVDDEVVAEGGEFTAEETKTFSVGTDTPVTSPTSSPVTPPTSPVTSPTSSYSYSYGPPPTSSYSYSYGPTSPVSPPSNVPTKAPTLPPTKVPTKAPTLPPTNAPTSAPTDSCILCDDVATNNMIKKGKDCATFNKLHKKCNKINKWKQNKFCQLSCYNAGVGYDGDVCCNGAAS